MHQLEQLHRGEVRIVDSEPPCRHVMVEEGCHRLTHAYGTCLVEVASDLRHAFGDADDDAMRGDDERL